MRPNPIVVRKLKEYDKHISVKWNNQYRCWEIWYKRPSGMKLITPIVESIYVEGGSANQYMPLDRRIIDWMYSADTWRHSKRWKWLNRQRFNERKRRDNEKFRNMCANIAKDQWTLLNPEYLNPYLWTQEQHKQELIQGKCTERVMYGKGLPE